MNYRQLQQALKPFKVAGLTNVKLNSKAAILEKELERLMASTPGGGGGSKSGSSKRGGGGSVAVVSKTDLDVFQKKFEESFKQERKEQELKGGVVAISPNQIAKRMNMKKSEFDKFFSDLEKEKRVFSVTEKNRKLVAIIE